MKLVTVIVFVVLLGLAVDAALPPKKCRHTPQEISNCRPGQKKYKWSYNMDKGKCKEIHGCYTNDQKNVFNSKTKCKEVCVV